ncbi:MAG: hypothetical protein R2774_09070 [Saprospiraceae bacterium]
MTVTGDKGCVSTTSVTVIVNPLPNGSISGDTEICVGASTTLTASGGSSYAWSTGDSELQDITVTQVAQQAILLQ